MAEPFIADPTAPRTGPRNVTAFFDTQEAANGARTDLVSAGISPDSISIIGGVGGMQSTSDDGGFWHALKEFFMADEDRHTYAEGLRRGGFALSVSTSEDQYDQAIDILDADGAVDIDEREQGWRSDGWSGRSNRDSAADEIAYGKVDSSTAGFGASLAGEDGYAPTGTLTTSGTEEAETHADAARVGTGAGTAGVLNPDFRERIGSGTASMTPSTPTGAQDAVLADNAALRDRGAQPYASAADAEDDVLGSPTRAGAELPAARSTIGSMASAESEQSTARGSRENLYRRDEAVRRSRVRGFILDPERGDRNGTL